MSKSIIAGILKNIELSPKAKQEILAGVPTSSQVKTELCDRVWAVTPAQLKTLTGGDRRVLFEHDGKRELLSLKAQADDVLLHLIALYDPEVVKANLLAARNDFYLLCTSVTEGIALSNMKSVSDPEMCDGIVFAADGRAVYWKQAAPGFVVDAVHGTGTPQIKTTVAEFRLRPGILAGVDQVSLQLLADQTGTTVPQLQRMDRSKDHKVLAELTLRVIAVLDVFKLETERQATFAELKGLVAGLGVKAEEEQAMCEMCEKSPAEWEGTTADGKTHKWCEYCLSVGGKHPSENPKMKKIEAAAITKEFDAKGEHAKPPTDKDHLSELLDDKKRPAVVIDKEPSKDPLKPKDSLYEAKEVSLKDLQKPDAGFALAVWCVTIEDAKAKAKDLERRRTDKRPLPDRWTPPASEAAGEGVEEKGSELNDGKVMRVKELKAPSSPQALQKPEDVDNATEQLNKVRQGAVMAGRETYKGYTIEPSGDNFYVKGPSGHRAFGEVPSSVEMAKKWIDQSLAPGGMDSFTQKRPGVKAKRKLNARDRQEGEEFSFGTKENLAEDFKTVAEEEGVELSDEDALGLADFYYGRIDSGRVEEQGMEVFWDQLRYFLTTDAKERGLLKAKKVMARRLPVKANAEDDESWDTGEVGLWINNEEGLYHAARGAHDGRSLETKVKELMQGVPDIKVDWLQVDWDAVYRDTVGADDEVQAKLKARAKKVFAARRLMAAKVKADTGMGEHDSEDIDGLDVRIYDNGGETIDRYTIVIENPETHEQSWLGSSDNPFWPQGFGQHVGDEQTGNQEGPHLGKRVYFKDVPEDVQKFIKQDTKAMGADSQNARNAEHGVDGVQGAPKKPKKGETEPKPKSELDKALADIPAERGGTKGTPGPGETEMDDSRTGPTEDFETRARAALAKELGAEPDDLKDAKVYYPNDEVESAGFEHGKMEYVVFADEDAAIKAAEESVRNDFGPHGEGPDLFNQDFIMGHVDRDGLKNYMEQVFEEWAESDASELSTEDKKEWSERNGHPDLVDEGTEIDYDAVFEEHRQDWIDERVEDQLGNDGGQSWWEENVGEEDFRKIIKDNGFIDVESLVEEAVSVDGAGHFLSSYDGATHDLDGGMVYIRTN